MKKTIVIITTTCDELKEKAIELANQNHNVLITEKIIDTGKTQSSIAFNLSETFDQIKKGKFNF